MRKKTVQMEKILSTSIMNFVVHFNEKMCLNMIQKPFLIDFFKRNIKYVK